MRIHVLTKEDTFRSLVSYDKEKKTTTPTKQTNEHDITLSNIILA